MDKIIQRIPGNENIEIAVLSTDFEIRKNNLREFWHVIGISRNVNGNNLKLMTEKRRPKRDHWMWLRMMRYIRLKKSSGCGCSWSQIVGIKTKERGEMRPILKV